LARSWWGKLTWTTTTEVGPGMKASPRKDAEDVANMTSVCCRVNSRTFGYRMDDIGCPLSSVDQMERRNIKSMEITRLMIEHSLIRPLQSCMSV